MHSANLEMRFAQASLSQDKSWPHIAQKHQNISETIDPSCLHYYFHAPKGNRVSGQGFINRPSTRCHSHLTSFCSNRMCGPILSTSIHAPTQQQQQQRQQSQDLKVVRAIRHDYRLSIMTSSHHRGGSLGGIFVCLQATL